MDKEKNNLIVDSYSYEISLVTTPYYTNLINKIKIPIKMFLAADDELFYNEEILKIIKKNILIKITIIPCLSHLDNEISK